MRCVVESTVRALRSLCRVLGSAADIRAQREQLDQPWLHRTG
jgi:hypothetical protein